MQSRKYQPARKAQLVHLQHVFALSCLSSERLGVGLETPIAMPLPSGRVSSAENDTAPRQQVFDLLARGRWIVAAVCTHRLGGLAALASTSPMNYSGETETREACVRVQEVASRDVSGRSAGCRPPSMRCSLSAKHPRLLRLLHERRGKALRNLMCNTN